MCKRSPVRRENSPDFEKKTLDGSELWNRSIFNDINAISAYLPYMDAVFADNEISRWLNALIKSGKITTATKIFLTITRDDILNYLKI
jgi:hypothetical protein